MPENWTEYAGVWGKKVFAAPCISIWDFFKLEFTPYNTEQPLRSMELQEKEVQKGIQEICLEETYN